MVCKQTEPSMTSRSDINGQAAVESHRSRERERPDSACELTQAVRGPLDAPCTLATAGASRSTVSMSPESFDIVSSDVLREQRLPPGQVSVSTDRLTGRPKWPVLHAGGVPQIDTSTWTLRLHGLVEEEVILDWDRFTRLPRHRVRCDIHCVTRWSRLDNVFEGPLVRTVLQHVRLKPDVSHVLVHAHSVDTGPWSTNLPLDAFADEDCLFATHHDGEPLSAEHGGPVRLVVPKLYFWKSAKWVQSVEFLRKDKPGFWERNGYHRLGDPWREQRYAF